MKTVAIFDKPWLANLAAARLQESGIRAFVEDEHTVQMDALLTNAIGGIKVQVADDDVESARRLLQQEPAAHAAPTCLCPRCSSGNVAPETLLRRISFLSLLLLGFPLIFRGRRLCCGDCNFEFKPSEAKNAGNPDAAEEGPTNGDRG